MITFTYFVFCLKCDQMNKHVNYKVPLYMNCKIILVPQSSYTMLLVACKVELDQC